MAGKRHLAAAIAGLAAAVAQAGLAAAEEFVIEDGRFRDRAAWVPLKDFRTGRKTLLPEALLPLVPADRAT